MSLHFLLRCVFSFGNWFANKWCCSGLLLISIPDFGNPELVNMGLSIEKPANGILKWATSLEFGEAEEEEAEVNHEHGKGKSNSRVDGEDIV